MRRLLCVSILFLAALAQGQERRVVLVSVDGLRPEIYLDPEAHGAELPTFRSLMREGAYAEAVEGVYPSVTYPSHTTIVTGVTPARHGILNNYVFDERGRFDDWYWYAESIRAPTLWDVAKGKTAAIHWPVTVGAAIDVNFPEYWIPGSDKSWREVRKDVVTPELFAAVESELGPLPEASIDDEPLEELVFDMAALVLERERPELLLLHVFNADTQQHRYGLEHREVAKAFELVDRRLGRLRDEIAQLGLADETLFVVTGDHGFIPTHTRIHLNVELRKAGLLRVGADGVVEDWRALVWPSGGSASIVLKDPGDGAARERLDALLNDLLGGSLGNAVTRVPRIELDRLGAMPGVAAALEAEEGFIFGNALDGELFTPSADLGYHGYLPTRAGMHTGFLIVGPGVRRGVRIPRMHQVDIAPTLAHWAGWELPSAEGLAAAEAVRGGEVSSRFCALVLLAASVTSAQGIPSPESVLGFEVGADFQLATYEESIAYFERLDAASDELELMTLAGSTLRASPS